MNQLTPGTILLHSISPEEFYDRIRAIIKEQMQQDQLLTKEGALKLTGVSNATFMRAIHEGTIKPQLVKGRSKAMYLESEVLKIQKKRKTTNEG
jgi:predicted DNA-binding transcriptional regulator AlpA